MGGLEMVKELRADDRTQDISIFMLTSDASPESENLARAVGADDYIVKPVQPQLLAARARAVMDRAEKSRQWVN
jgi:DNA-binding response OmpR family regulator